MKIRMKMIESEYSERKEIASVALEQLLDTPTMQNVEVANPHCRHCGKEIESGDLIFNRDENDEN